DDGAHDGHDESRRVKLRAGLGLADDPPDQAADDGADDADERRGNDAHGVETGHHGAGDQTHDETHDEGPKDVEHGVLLFSSVALVSGQPGAAAGLLAGGAEHESHSYDVACPAVRGLSPPSPLRGGAVVIRASCNDQLPSPPPSPWEGEGERLKDGGASGMVWEPRVGRVEPGQGRWHDA